MEDLQKSIRSLKIAASILSLKLERVNQQVEKLIEERRHGPFQGSRLPPVRLGSMGKKEFAIPETECWDDNDEPPFSLRFDLDNQQLERLGRRAASSCSACGQIGGCA